MIKGTVTDYLEPLVPLVLVETNGKTHDVEAIVDTGFDGALSLPSSVIATLGWSWRTRGRALLADGSESVFDIYEGKVLWDGKPRRILVDEADTTPLIGMSLLSGYKLEMEIQKAGKITIVRL